MSKSNKVKFNNTNNLNLCMLYQFRQYRPIFVNMIFTVKLSLILICSLFMFVFVVYIRVITYIVHVQYRLSRQYSLINFMMKYTLKKQC